MCSTWNFVTIDRTLLKFKSPVCHHCVFWTLVDFRRMEMNEHLSKLFVPLLWGKRSLKSWGGVQIWKLRIISIQRTILASEKWVSGSHQGCTNGFEIDLWAARRHYSAPEFMDCGTNGNGSAFSERTWLMSKGQLNDRQSHSVVIVCNTQAGALIGNGKFEVRHWASFSPTND